MVLDLAVIRADPAADRKLLEAIADWCVRYTPLVALDPPHGLFLDITGASHLYDSEQAMMLDVGRSIAAQGFSVHVALAGTAEAARALAHYRCGMIAEPGCEAEAVAALPTEALVADPYILHALNRAGLKTIGQVAERSRQELVARFGKGFAALLDRTLGKIGGPIMPRLPVPDLSAERRFSEPVVTEAVITETLLSLCQSLASVLETHGQGARVLEAMFFRADGATRRIVVETARPTRDAKIFIRLFREKLDSLVDPLDPGFGFDLIRLSANFAQDLQAKNAELDASAADAEVHLLMDRLAARFGSQRVLVFRPQDTHIPEAETVAIPARHADDVSLPKHGFRERDETSRRPLRLFAKPEPVDVLASAPDGQPIRFRWRRVLHTIARAEGPERIAMEWWRHQESQPTRDYFRVEDEKGRRYWLYRDGVVPRELTHPSWYVHGLFA